MGDRRSSNDERILLLAITSADESLSQSLATEAGLNCLACADLSSLVQELSQGAGAILLTEESLTAGNAPDLAAELDRQPPWSDIPVLVLMGAGADSCAVARVMELLGNVTVLERPVRTIHLQIALRTALRARCRQYEFRDQLEALQRSESNLSDFFENANVGLHWVGPDGTILRANQAELDLLGYHREEYVGRHIADFHVDRATIDDILARLARGVALKNVSARLRCKDESIKDVLISFSVLWDHDKFVHTRCFTLDVTERRRAEEAVALNAAIVESSDDAITGMDLEGTILSWNGGAERLYGYSADKVIGRSISHIIPPDRQGEELSILQRLAHGERVDHFETQRLSKTGQLIDVSLTVSPLRDGSGRLFGASKVARDITARKLTEEILRKRGERLHLLWDAAAVLLTTDEPDVLVRTLFAKIAPHFSLDAYFNFLVNETGDALRLQSYSGISEKEARSFSRLEFGQAICGTVAVQREPFVATHIQKSDDPIFQLAKRLGLRAYACSPLIIHGKVLGTLSFASRQRDEFEDDELDFLETIAYYVTVAYERLRLIEELRNADRRKDEFLATLAHELRNPLAPIGNGLQIMRLAGRDPAATEQARTLMERQLRQMVRLIDDLLDVSRITRGKLQLRKERVELAAVVSSAVDTARPLIDAAGHKLTVSLPPEPIYLDADPIRLAQVFSNLLNNAAKYTERGGQIRLSASLENNQIAVLVQDTGIGISSDALPHIFEMFTQVDRSLEKSQGGLGIGLTLVKRLVEMHGGSVQASSDGAGQGSTFTVHLPVVSSAPPVSLPGKSTPPASVVACRILVADDNRDAAESMGMMLRLMGNEVRTVHDGLAAVEEAAAFRPDMVLLDIGMPRLNGYDAARRIREERWGLEMFLVALTGWGQDEDKRKASEAGFDKHFTKPINPSELSQLVAAMQTNPEHRQSGQFHSR